jgi:hypothetical protein
MKSAREKLVQIVGALRPAQQKARHKGRAFRDR